MSLPWVMIKSNPAPSTYCRQGWLDSTCCKRGYRWSLTGWHFFPAKLSGVGLWSVPKIYKRSHFRSIRIFEMWRRLRSLINAKSISWRDHRKNVWIDASVSDRSVFPSRSQSSTTLFFIVFHSNFRRTRIFINISGAKMLYPNLGRTLKLTKIKFLLCVVPNRGKPTAKSDKNQVKNVKNLKTWTKIG